MKTGTRYKNFILVFIIVIVVIIFVLMDNHNKASITTVATPPPKVETTEMNYSEKYRLVSKGMQLLKELRDIKSHTGIVLPNSVVEISKAFKGSDDVVWLYITFQDLNNEKFSGYIQEKDTVKLDDTNYKQIQSDVIIREQSLIYDTEDFNKINSTKPTILKTSEVCRLQERKDGFVRLTLKGNKNIWVLEKFIQFPYNYGIDYNQDKIKNYVLKASSEELSKVWNSFDPNLFSYPTINNKKVLLKNKTSLIFAESINSTLEVTKIIDLSKIIEVSKIETNSIYASPSPDYNYLLIGYVMSNATDNIRGNNMAIYSLKDNKIIYSIEKSDYFQCSSNSRYYLFSTINPKNQNIKIVVNDVITNNSNELEFYEKDMMDKGVIYDFSLLDNGDVFLNGEKKYIFRKSKGYKKESVDFNGRYLGCKNENVFYYDNGKIMKYSEGESTLVMDIGSDYKIRGSMNYKGGNENSFVVFANSNSSRVFDYDKTLFDYGFIDTTNPIRSVSPDFSKCIVANTDMTLILGTDGSRDIIYNENANRNSFQWFDNDNVISVDYSQMDRNNLGMTGIFKLIEKNLKNGDTSIYSLKTE